MRMRHLRCLAGLLLVVSCRSRGEEPPVAIRSEFLTPEAAVNTFLRACADRDVDLLSRCFASTAEGEFKHLVEKTATNEMLGELKEMFAGALIAGSIEVEAARATVVVALKWSGRDEERLRMVREGRDWKIAGF